MHARFLFSPSVLVISLLILWGKVGHAEPVSGRVLDNVTLAGVAGALIRAEPTGTTAITDSDGGFVIDAAGSVTLTVEALGFFNDSLELQVGPEGKEDVLLVLISLVGGEVIEVFDRRAQSHKVAGQTELSREELVKSPGTRGDALHAVRNLPGIANFDPFTPGEFAFGLVIRGSSPEDSKYFVNGIELPLLYHFFGLQSILPSEMVEDIEYIPGGFDVQFGGSTAGIINIHTRAAAADEWTGFAELSFINVAALVEGPISKANKLFMTAAIRRSVIDALVPLAIPDDVDLSFTTLPQYYDGQVRIDWEPVDQHNLMLMAFTSLDTASGTSSEENVTDPNATGDFKNQVSFTRVAGSYHYTNESSEVFGRSWIGPGNFEFKQGQGLFQEASGLIVGGRVDLRHRLKPWLQLRTGGEFQTFHARFDARFPLVPTEGQPGVPNSTTDKPLVLNNRLFKQDTSGLYGAADFQPIEGLRFTTGMRYDNYLSNDAETLSPRVSAEYSFGGDWKLMGSAGRYTRQPTGFESFRNDLEPESSMHYVAGVRYQATEELEVKFSGFVNDMENLVVFDPSLIRDDPTQGWINQGTGLSRGLETMVRARRHNFFGWLSYTLQKSDRQDSAGQPDRLFDFDQTHNVVVVGSYLHGPWRFGGRFQVATGEPDTPIVGAVYDSDIDVYRPEFGNVNSKRKENAHQLDVRVERDFTFDGWKLAAYLDITNVYAHSREISQTYNFNYTESEPITTLPIFPALGVRGSF